MPERSLQEIPQSAEEPASAFFEDALARLSDAVEHAAGREVRWLDRARAGLVELLGFLDDEPACRRALVVEERVAGAPAASRARRTRDVLATLLDRERDDAVVGAELSYSRQLTTELVLGAVFSVIRARITDPEGAWGPLVELAPSLMSFIAVAYLGQAAASAQLVAGDALARRTLSSAPELPALSPVHLTRRTTLVLRAIARAPRSSNREIAAAAGIADEGQTSHLLRRLARRGMIAKVEPSSGSRRENAWLLTPAGRRATELLGVSTPASSYAYGSSRVGEPKR